MRKEPVRLKTSNIFFKAFIVGETALFVACLSVYVRMNRSPAFRRRMYDEQPMVSNAYYWIGEKMGGTYDIRRCDYERWGVSGQK